MDGGGKNQIYRHREEGGMKGGGGERDVKVDGLMGRRDGGRSRGSEEGGEDDGWMRGGLRRRWTEEETRDLLNSSFCCFCFSSFHLSIRK